MMNAEEARNILMKDKKCFEKEGSVHCALNVGCTGCPLFVSSDELAEAKRVLKEGEQK